jgi:glycosyl hydrolase family 20
MTLESFRQGPRMVFEITLWSCLVSLGLHSSAFCQARIYPEPQQIEILETNFPLDDRAVVVLPVKASENDLFLARFFVAELADRYGLALNTEHLTKLPAARRVILMGSISNPLVKAYCLQHKVDVTDRQPGPEGYFLQVNENLVLIAGSDDAGAFYGLQSLRQLVEKVPRALQIHGARVRDWPYKPFRGIKLYLPGHENIPFFKRFVRNFMALYKYNKLIVELNAGMRLDRHPELNAGWLDFARNLTYTRRDRPEGPHRQYQDSSHYDTADGGVLEKEEVADLVRWAQEHFIEVIPEIPSLTHSYYLLTRHRELAEIPEAEWPDTYCPSNPQSYKLLFDVLDEYIQVMKPRMIHIGHDEWRMPWGVCPLCRSHDPRELFAQDVRKIHDHLAAQGVKTALWGDHLLEAVTGKRLSPRVSPSGYHYDIPGGLSAAQVRALIPKDILVFNWFWNDAENRPSNPERYGEVDDLQLQDLGFQQVYGNMTPAIQNYGRRSSRASVLGGAPSAWEATTEFNFGKDLLEDFVGCASLLWSKHWVAPEQLPQILRTLMPDIRRNLSGKAVPSDLGDPVVPLEIASHFSPSPPPNVVSLKAADLKTGKLTFGNLIFDLADPNSLGGKYGVIATTGTAYSPRISDEGEGLPVGEDVSSLIFLHACAGPANLAPGYTYIFNFPDTADLLGWYEVVFEDGFIATIPIRYGVNIREWDWGKGDPARGYVYGADAITLGNQQGVPITFFAFEWANPRLGKTVREVRLRGSSGFMNTRGNVMPENAVILLALSVVKKRSVPSP